MSSQAATLARFMKGQQRTPVVLPHAIAVASGKGGSGTSTIAALAALGAQQLGRERTLLVDADDGIGSLHMLLGVQQNEADMKKPRDLLPGLRLIGAASRAGQSHRNSLHQCAREFRDSSFVVVDVGARTAALEATILSGVSRIVLVTTTDAVAIASTYAVMKLSHTIRPDLEFDVLVNRARPNEGVHTFGVLECAAREFLGVTPSLLGAVPDHEQYTHTIFGALLTTDGTELPFATAARAIAEYVLRTIKRPL